MTEETVTIRVATVQMALLTAAAILGISLLWWLATRACRGLRRSDREKPTRWKFLARLASTCGRP